MNLTHMWKAVGGKAAQKPTFWFRQADTQNFLKTLGKKLKLTQSQLYTIKRGGGTWAHWQIGLAYAKYLSPEFHIWCNEAINMFCGISEP